MIRTWKLSIELVERKEGEPSYNATKVGSTELSISGENDPVIVGRVAAAHAQAILATAEATKVEATVEGI